jgi:hypothetical protein
MQTSLRFDSHPHQNFLFTMHQYNEASAMKRLFVSLKALEEAVTPVMAQTQQAGSLVKLL